MIESKKLLNYLSKVVDIRGWALMFGISEGPKNEKRSIHGMKTKEIMSILMWDERYLKWVMLQKYLCALKGE